LIDDLYFECQYGEKQLVTEHYLKSCRATASLSNRFYSDCPTPEGRNYRAVVPLWHQAETVKAVSADIDVVFNTAMTGDGKSLASGHSAGHYSAIGLYPTNERDQETKFRGISSNFSL